MQKSPAVLFSQQLDHDSDTQLADSLAAITLDQAIDLVGGIGQWPVTKRYRRLARLFQHVPGAQRGVFLLALLRSESRENIDYAYEQIYRVEVPQLQQHLIANHLESQAEDAIDFAVTQLLDYAHSIDHLRGWLRTIAVRKAVQLKKKQPNTLEDGADEAISLSSWLTEKDAEARSYASELVIDCRNTAISSLENQILEYYFFQERSGTEIATLVQVSKSSIYLQIKTAVDKLRRCLEFKLR